MHHEYRDAGFRIFGLHGVTNGVCNCGNKNCEAAYKHPRNSAWQHTPPSWSDDQFEFMEEFGHFDTGFGVLCSGHVIIDIDPRNGGSLESLPDEWKDCGFIVATGGGGWHLYFKHDGEPLKQHLDQFKGIDFKSTGFVVGAGSLHKSGLLYEVESGSPEAITNAPQSLIDALKKPERHKTEYNGASIDVSNQELQEMLSHVDPSCGYDEWIRVGMALHEATSGGEDGLYIWDGWSSKGSNYSGDLDKHWHSFGKHATPVSVATLIHVAEQNGYKQSVTFESDIKVKHNNCDIDLLKPPGFVGEIAQWINQQCRFPRERLAVAAALSVVGNVAGMRYIDKDYGSTANMFMFCVAGSATGKEAIQQAQYKLMCEAGVSEAVHGTIKSEQEIIRNLTKNRAAFYAVDEIGILLSKIKNAKGSGASYLEGVIGLLMSAYSKANGVLPLGGDVKEEVREKMNKELSFAVKKVNENEDKTGYFQRVITRLESKIPEISQGLINPYLSLIGYTTPVTFDHLVDHEQTTNGFIGRSIIFMEQETNPKPNRAFNPSDVPGGLSMQLKQLYSGGETPDIDFVDVYGGKVEISTTDEAKELLSSVFDKFHTMSEDAKLTSLEAVPRRAFELVLKVSLALAVQEGVRTFEHVKWATALIESDIRDKMNLAASNIATEYNSKDEALVRRLFSQASGDDFTKRGVLINRNRGYRKEDVQKALALMVEKGILEERPTDSAKPGVEYRRIGSI